MAGARKRTRGRPKGLTSRTADVGLMVEVFRWLYHDVPLRLGDDDASLKVHARWRAGLDADARRRFPEPDLVLDPSHKRYRFMSIAHAVSGALLSNFSIQMTAAQVAGAYERWLAAGKPGAESVEKWALRSGIRLQIKKGNNRA